MKQDKQVGKERESGQTRRKRVKLDAPTVDLQLLTRNVQQNESVPSDVLARFPLLAEKCDLTAHAEALRWLVYDRHIGLRSISQFQLRLYVNALDEVGVIFPIINMDGVTVLDMWARLVSNKNFFRVTAGHTDTQLAYRPQVNLPFGIHLFKPDRPLMLVDWALDALRLHTLGVKNVLATQGDVSSELLASLSNPVVYLGFNSGEAGRSLTKKAVKSIPAPSLAILDWSVVGIQNAGELENKDQFVQVFDKHVKILR